MQRLAETADRLSERPRAVLAVLVAAQIACTGALAASVHHNGWLFYQGGDQLWYTTTGWFLAHGQLPVTLIGPGWSLVLAPIMGLFGPDFVSSLPPTLLLNVLVLGPLTTICVYWLGALLGGRLLGYWSAVVWIVLPFAAIPLFVHRYHDTYVDQVLPQSLGLTSMADYPSMVAAAVAAVFVLRSIRAGQAVDALAAGLAAGYLVAVKPSNALFLGGPVLAYLLARRWRAGAAFAVAIVPGTIALAIWKQRGLGQIPVLSLGEVRAAAGISLPVADSYRDRLVPIDVHNFAQNMDYLREFFWSNRLVQWVPFAGLVAVARRSLSGAGLLAGWLFAYVLIKGSSSVASIERGDFWRLVMPAFPAFVVLLAFLPLLVPGVASRLGDRITPVAGPAVGRRTLVAGAVVLALVPIAVASVWPLVTGPRDGVIVNNILVPVDGKALPVTATRQGVAQRITWDDRSGTGGRVFYRVFRTERPGDDVDCEPWGAPKCFLQMIVLATTRGRSFVDRSPQPGVSYRVGIGANWIDDQTGGDVFLVSKRVEAAS